ncbi:hypothetical protein H310_07657 [Aphanomyces invadans]|uniref:Uncharacterized protein n=1 Tax=Aphanomyces invadans TaxID=157072 RepID=A0A024U306_9STRA|nr:hypothetical protein H310_07657 [Aphanomyces invadans]ETW00277.1 hypothetical protein H310_07657 [Aphanomyces invadans]|eukprot:XP_008871302.1 hypothetical protein H310_07657 [Aphanomyces invadans]
MDKCKKERCFATAVAAEVSEHRQRPSIASIGAFIWQALHKRKREGSKISWRVRRRQRVPQRRDYRGHHGCVVLEESVVVGRDRVLLPFKVESLVQEPALALLGGVPRKFVGFRNQFLHSALDDNVENGMGTAASYNTCGYVDLWRMHQRLDSRCLSRKHFLHGELQRHLVI